jgi:hypothetical protein
MCQLQIASLDEIIRLHDPPFDDSRPSFVDRRRITSFLVQPIGPGPMSSGSDPLAFLPTGR